MNPNPHETEHTLRLDASLAAPDLAAVLACADFYRLGKCAAARMVRQVRAALAPWRERAAALGLPRSQID